MNSAGPEVEIAVATGTGAGFPRIASKADRVAGSYVYASAGAFEDALDRDPELRMYRGRSIGMLRRYMRFSMETGRLPSLLGRELFRAKVTSYTVATFEDRVILVHDMEMALGRVSDFSQQVIARYFLQEHDLFATARLLHCNEKTIRRSIPIALDELSEILLEIGLLQRSESEREKSCQGGETGQFSASDCNEGENKHDYSLDTNAPCLVQSFCRDRALNFRREVQSSDPLAIFFIASGS